ncbi:MAG: LysM peptidoglycan-binding domain-containing protein [Candidatus Promineifilaceae bacterium]|jgi:LysM repeat protein
MRNRIQIRWIEIILVMISLTVTACVRPYPGGEAESAVPTLDPSNTQPPAFVTLIPTITPVPSFETPEPTIPNPTPIIVEPTAETPTESIYTVVAGDTLFKIALQFDVTVDAIAEANGIIDIDSLEIGQELIIPAPGSEGSLDQTDSSQGTEANEETANTDGDTSGSAESGESTTVTEQPTPASAAGGVHIVQPGENLFRIGLQYGCTVEQVARYNGITTPNRIPVGLEIRIPDCN